MLISTLWIVLATSVCMMYNYSGRQYPTKYTEFRATGSWQWHGNGDGQTRYRQSREWQRHCQIYSTRVRDCCLYVLLHIVMLRKNLNCSSIAEITLCLDSRSIDILTLLFGFTSSGWCFMHGMGLKWNSCEVNFLWWRM